MALTDVDKFKKIANHILESRDNSRANEDQDLVRKLIIDSVYWINTHQLIYNQYYDELKSIGFIGPMPKDYTHFIDDINLFCAELKRQLSHHPGDQFTIDDSIFDIIMDDDG